MLQSQLDIYKASAGSGKTFLLTKQYLKLLLQNPYAYRGILAVTFTNKATAEMKHRILSELRELANGKETNYSKIIAEELSNITSTFIQKQAHTAYTAILHDYSRFAISTIDSFVQKIIRSFAYEIGLDSGFRLQLNTDLVKEDLALRLYHLLDENENLLHWVVEMATARLSEGKNWDFKTDMLELANELFKEQFQPFEIAMHSMNADEKTEAFKKLRDHIYTIIQQFENAQVKVAKDAIEFIEANNLTPDDFHYGKSGFINHFYKISKRQFDEPGKRVKDFIDNPEKVARPKASAYKKDIINSMCDQLHTLMKELVEDYNNNSEKYYTAKAISGNLYTLQLMEVFSKELANYRSDKNELLISDTHLLLRQLCKENDASFIFEKTGNRYHHFLIDEFQDTSVFQWDNFKPLLENTLSQGFYNLIVGDIKQAIYRWRSGDWRLLLSTVKEQLKNYSIQENTLQDNYRSAKHIINFNNYLFATIPKILQERFNSEMGQAPLDIQEKLKANGYFNIIENAYADSFQQAPSNAAENGYVQINFLNENEEENLSFKEQVLNKLPLQIESLIKKGYQPGDIAILVRENREAQDIIQFIIQHQQEKDSLQYNVISAEVLYISANEAVQIIIAAIRWLINKNDLISRSFLLKCIINRNNISVSNHALYASNGNGENFLPPALLQQRETLQSLPIIELVNRLINIFSLQNNETDLPYLLAFQDIILEWSRFGEDHLQAFLEYWEEEGVKKSLPASNNNNAVEVMTIHKSKGLAFNVLMLPFCNWMLEPDPKKSNYLWVQTKSTDFNEIPVVPIKYKKDLAHSTFAYTYFEEQLLSNMDALNLLYVATTRARREIIAYAPLPNSKSSDNKIKTVGDTIFYALQNKVVLNNSDIPYISDAFDSNQLNYGSSIITKPEIKNQSSETGFSLKDIVYTNWGNKLNIRPSSLLLQEEAAMLPRSMGTILHQALSKLQHPDDLSVVLWEMEIKGIITPTIKKDIKSILEKVINNPLMENWRNGNMQRISERDIITPRGSFKRPDLVLIGQDSTIVIDFKFTEEKDDKLKKQLSEYVELLKQMNFKNVSGYLLYGLIGEIDKI